MLRSRGVLRVPNGPEDLQNPAEVNAARDDIAKINLPAGFQPVTMFKMDNFFMTMTAVEYRDSAIDGRFSMAEMQLKVGEPSQRDQAMRQQLEKQGIGTPKTLRNAKS